MINKTICIDGLVNHLLCPMLCCLNGVQISKNLKILAKNLNETTYARELINCFDTAHPLIIMLHLSGVTNYFDVCFLMLQPILPQNLTMLHYAEPLTSNLLGLHAYKEQSQRHFFYFQDLQHNHCHGNKRVPMVFHFFG